ncbi:CcdB family protein [Caulobacter sp. ErkDOM-YI]|uniref:CcdB family protein n=1 Tax=unclassified Caulobacter TaxID=2648921 RepID=UPI003AF46DD5
MIRQFDVFQNPSIRSRDRAPYVIVLQSHHAGDLPTVVVAPLYHPADLEGLTKLTVEVVCDGIDLVISLPQLAAINATSLHHKVANLATDEDDIRSALDRLFIGF